jgi:hypothetical protein
MNAAPTLHIGGFVYSKSELSTTTEHKAPVLIQESSSLYHLQFDTTATRYKIQEKDYDIHFDDISIHCHGIFHYTTDLNDLINMMIRKINDRNSTV